ncbi:hypothetical protein [Fluviicola chungangensis]|uniref:Uncharacterized protein n=1 Tax=Fluviicola chungangensis TaxID=2597671 RepID=A0A556N2X6_9FLAO|nr:hypothetical protein [Fluviicola chungangensis]TSJ46378.1 hypothetical protein FO442_04265 [Fluviicola chungangensis]
MKQSKVASVGFLIGLFLLLLNDFYLKETYGNWLTGKLSDFAGLFIFPIFLGLFNAKRIQLNYIFSTVFFVFWKSDLSTDFLLLTNQLFHTEFSRVVDYSDLIALSILPLSYWYSAKAKNRNFQFLKPVIVCVSVFSFYATSTPDSDRNTPITGRYYRVWDSETFDQPVLQIGYQSKSCTSCYGIILGPDVVSYGYNDDFILAKINPVINDTSKTVYAILVVSKDSTDNFGDKEVYNGLSQTDFLQKRKELHVPHSIVLRKR